MAINKSTAPAWVKGVIIFVALTFVVSVGGLASLSLTPGSSTGTNNPNTGANGIQTTSTIASQYASRTVGIEEALKGDPKNYDLLLAGAQTYQDWATQVAQLGAAGGGADAPLWQKSVELYRQALEVKPGDPNATTDYSISQFSSGDASAAIATAEAVAKANPTFAPVQFNLGVYYSALNDNAKAIAAYEAYKKLDPQGQLVSEANTRLQSLRSGGTAPTP